MWSKSSLQQSSLLLCLEFSRSIIRNRGSHRVREPLAATTMEMICLLLEMSPDFWQRLNNHGVQRPRESSDARWTAQHMHWDVRYEPSLLGPFVYLEAVACFSSHAGSFWNRFQSLDLGVGGWTHSVSSVSLASVFIFLHWPRLILQTNYLLTSGIFPVSFSTFMFFSFH